MKKSKETAYHDAKSHCVFICSFTCYDLMARSTFYEQITKNGNL